MSDSGSNDAREPETGTTHAQPEREGETPPHSPTTLRGFFERSEVKAAVFIKALAERQVTAFDPADEERALAVIRASEDGIRRLIELMQAAIRTQHSKNIGGAARCAVAFSARVARVLLEEAGLPASDTELSTEAFARAAVDGLAGEGDGHVEARFSLLKLVLWLMVARRGLRGPAIAYLVRNYLLATGRKPTPSDLNLLAHLAGPATRVAGVRRNLGLIEPFVLSSEEARRQAEMYRQALEASKASLRKLDEDLQAEHGISEGLRARCSALQREIAQLQQEAADRRAAHAHQTRNQRGAFEKFLERDVKIRVKDAVAASKLEPPHLNVVRERLQMVLELIDGELASGRRQSEHANSRT